MAKTLAVEYRPQTFDEVVEQTAVKQILEHQITSGTFKNAYLFTGAAGTGKTTSARIFARGINGGTEGMIEIDAASNNSIDDIRGLTDMAKYRSLAGKYKVFVLDECHILSNSAFQALLKILEEPPALSIFILCTTDPQKIPTTILSRVQRFDFKRITVKGIATRLKAVAADIDEFNIDDAAIDYIAVMADGCMREGLSLLEKCLSFDNNINEAKVAEALGVVAIEGVINLYKAIVENDGKGVVLIVEDLYEEGKDMKEVITSLISVALDVRKFGFTGSWEHINLPVLHKDFLETVEPFSMEEIMGLFNLATDIKFESNPKPLVLATLLFMAGV